MSNYSWQQKSLDYKKTDHFRRFEYNIEFKKQNQLGFSVRNQFIYLSNPFDPTRSENGEPLPANIDYTFNQW